MTAVIGFTPTRVGFGNQTIPGVGRRFIMGDGNCIAAVAGFGRRTVFGDRHGSAGEAKATIAVGHTLLVIVYHVLADEKDYEELGGNYFDEWDRQAVQKRLVRRLEKLGYEVMLTPTWPAV